ncbi:MAG: ATP-binding protein [Planctomycetota bacterium]|nr:ATP-binding protein [Planctomycetota bacterium]
MAAIASVALSFLTNPISATWLIGLFITGALLFVSLRQWRDSALFKSYTLYLVMFLFYQFVIWVVYVSIPDKDQTLAKQKVLLATRYLGFGGVYMGVAIYHLTLHFAEVKTRIWHWLDVIGWIVGFGFHCSQLRGDFFGDFHWNNEKWVPTMTAHYPYFFGYITFYVSLGLGIPLVVAIRHPDRQRRNQLIFYLAGALPLWLSCWSHFLLSMGIFVPTGGGLFLIVHALILGYAVFRRRLFDLTLVVRRGLPYALVSAGLGLSFGFLIYLSWKSAEALGLNSTFGGAVVLAMVAGVIYAPLFAVLQSFIDKAFLRSRRNREALLADYTKEVSSTLDLDRVMLQFGRILYQVLGPTRVRLFISSNAHGDLVPFGRYEEGLNVESYSPKDSVSEAWRAWLQEHAPKRAAKLERLACEIPVPAPGLVIDEGPERMVVPIMGHGTIQGYAVLGAKRSDDPYWAEDLQFAETVAASSAAALQNARSYHEVRQMHLLLRDTLESLSAGVILVRQDGTVELTNASFRRLLATSPDLQGDSPTSLNALHLQDPELIKVLASRIKSSDQVDNLPLNQVLPVERFLMLSMRMLQSGTEIPLYLFLIHDLTAFKRMEDELKRQEALARVGELVSAINHEIRNMINPIRGTLTRLQSLEIEHPIFRRSMQLLPDRIALMDLMLENLRNYTRPIELRRRAVSIARLLTAAMRDLESLCSEAGVEVKLHSSADSDLCHGDGNWLAQVFYNLIKNSVEAVTGCEERHIELRITNSSGYLQVSVWDSGVGIRPEHQRRLFQPFFSTKGRQGTGLGLCLCQKLIELHEGRIEISSEPDRGTMVTIYLPVAHGESEPISESSETGLLEG